MPPPNTFLKVYIGAAGSTCLFLFSNCPCCETIHTLFQTAVKLILEL